MICLHKIHIPDTNVHSLPEMLPSLPAFADLQNALPITIMSHAAQHLPRDSFDGGEGVAIVLDIQNSPVLHIPHHQNRRERMAGHLVDDSATEPAERKIP